MFGPNKQDQVKPTVTNYFLINRPDTQYRFYPSIDHSRCGPAWLGDARIKDTYNQGWPDLVSFFEFMHICIWRDIVTNDRDYKYTRNAAMFSYQKNFWKTVNAVPLIQLKSAADGYFDDGVITPQTGLILDSMYEAKLTREFLITYYHTFPRQMHLIDFLGAIFFSLLGHQFTHTEPDKSFRHTPPPFKIINPYGISFDHPHNSLEEHSLYPCGLMDDNIIFGSMDYPKDYLAVKPVTIEIGHNYD